MKSDILSFQKSADDFIDVFKTIPLQALSYKPQGDDYTLGGLIVHVLDVMKKYSSLLDSIVDPKHEPVRCDHHISEKETQWIREGISGEERIVFLKELESLQKHIAQRLEALSQKHYETKTPVIYENSNDPYPTSPGDLLGWLKDHYIEHTSHIKKLLNDWQNM